MKADHAYKFSRWLPLLGVALLALLVRWIAWLFFRDSVLYVPPETSGHDRSIYLLAIQRIADGKFWPDGAFEYLPLYPWIAGLFASLTGHPLEAAALLGAICDSATAVLIVVLARRVGASTMAATIAGALYAAYPLAAIYSILTMPNTLNGLGIIAFALVGHRLWSRATTTRHAALFLLGILGGIVALGFAGMLMMAGFTAAAFSFRDRSFRPAMLIVAGLILVLLPVIIHNSRAEGRLTMLTTHGGFNVYMGNHREATGYPLRIRDFRMTAKEMLEDAHRYAEQQSGKPLTRSESSAWWSSQARAFWMEHPLEALFLTARKAALFWNRTDMDDLRVLETLRITDPVFQRWYGTPFAVFGFAGLIGLFYSRQSTIPKLMLLAGMIGLMMFFITARYRLALVPLMAVTGAAGFPFWLQHIASREWKHMAGTAAMALVVLLPVQVRDQRPIDHYNAATQLLNAGRIERADAVVQAGLEIAPGYAELHFAKGSVLFKQQQYQAAADSFEQSLAIKPNQPTAAFNLALSLARAGDYCGARDAILRMQQRQIPTDDRMRQLLRDVSAACDAR